ncbi:DUF2608 domain-containing protein [Parachlamydia acanthamoebae]|uniref:DUF2608 domain-containing protein n=1 Tax=Parachlamydia acanthamoebae TaxID=83552 RepID=UPI0007515173|nr:DUF2608 domain-containing protein [Parachlamydia acanthamoebae]
MLKKILYTTSFYFLLFYSTLFSKIVETPHFSEIVAYAKPNTLLILDIDDTLLIPVQTIGTDAWFMHRLKIHECREKVYAAALDKALAEWEAIRHLTHVKIVEEGTDQIIDDLQKQKITIMGLTTQGLALTTRTVNQLHSLKIDLSRTAPSAEDHYFINDHGILYRNGILFTSGTNKGKALLKLLDLINYHPNRIVFINDKLKHLQDVEASVLSRNIDFIGLRYSYSDQRVANFCPEIANIQWRYSTFNHLMSDEEAERLLHTAPLPVQ